MRNTFTAFAAATGLAFSGCGGGEQAVEFESPVTPEVTPALVETAPEQPPETEITPKIEKGLVKEIKAKYTGKFPCPQIGKVAIDIRPLTEEEVAGPEGTSSGQGAAFTRGNKVVIDSALEPRDIKNAGKHEMFHGCVDKDPRSFPKPYMLEQDGSTMVGARGFQLVFSDETFFTFADEGFAELVSTGIDGYEPSDNPSYNAVHLTAKTLAARANLSRKKVAQLHSESDLLSLVAKIYGVERSEVGSAELSNFVGMFNTAYTSEQPVDGSTL